MVFFSFMLALFLFILSVNTHKEYYDLKSRLDFKSNKTSFSGGSGEQQGNPTLAETIRQLAGYHLIQTIIAASNTIREQFATYLNDQYGYPTVND